ncbi:2-methylcitrate synthase/citrate synthase II [Salinarchaeum sp. Harcht-Bsk1]|uniref:citrate synthase n=1 Tax=Salinarchaeum sp. Harcht-Bsk1 TaxID=1333523 RepID=UPI0003423DD1|nr:citrate synthase [Salinarchaeum sp. Harcht-Bsk1]AGN01717.1 2-methylcitrate synthase/citrate synthase II [Salinarchaeum sp. Harcht-Bsk1]
MLEDVQKGLEGVLVAESGLSSIDGDAGRLIYRGYDIETLAREATYEEVLYLLWHDELPTAEELEAFADSIAEERELSADVLETVRRLAASGEEPMAALRTAVSALSADEPEPDADPEDLDATLRKGRRITAKIPTILAAFERYRMDEAPVDPHPDLDLAENFLYMLTGEEPDDIAAETIDQALILHADHGLNASTFTSMVVASTMADVYSSVTAGIGALSGPLHGGANQDVMEMLIEVDESDRDPLDWVKNATDEGRRIPGFGHRVYNVKDPRAKILQARCKELSEANGDEKWYDYTTTIEEYLTEEQGLVEKGIAPNVDFYSGTVYYQLGIPVDMYTPIFAMSRVGGWVGHVLEYQEDNRLIRPRGRYTGPEEAEWVPIDER